MKLTLLAALSLTLAVASAAHPGKTTASLGPVARSAITYFEDRIEGRNFDRFLRSIRPARLSGDARAQVIATLPREGEVKPSAKMLSKLSTLGPVLQYHDRAADIEIKVIRVSLAFVGLHARTVLLISEQVLDLLRAEELQAVVAHELGHDYFWDEYEPARHHKQYEKVKELELRCDGIAIITLSQLGMDPRLLFSGLAKLARYNEWVGVTANPDLYTSLDERERFNRVMIELVKTRMGQA